MRDSSLDRRGFLTTLAGVSIQLITDPSFAADPWHANDRISYQFVRLPRGMTEAQALRVKENPELRGIKVGLDPSGEYKEHERSILRLLKEEVPKRFLAQSESWFGVGQDSLVLSRKLCISISLHAGKSGGYTQFSVRNDGSEILDAWLLGNPESIAGWILNHELNHAVLLNHFGPAHRLPSLMLEGAATQEEGELAAGSVAHDVRTRILSTRPMLMSEALRVRMKHIPISLPDRFAFYSAAHWVVKALLAETVNPTEQKREVGKFMALLDKGACFEEALDLHYSIPIDQLRKNSSFLWSDYCKSGGRS